MISSRGAVSENVKQEPQSQYKQQKAVIEFLTNEGIKLIELFCRLKVVYSDETMDVSNVWAWARKANAGPINLFDKPCSGYPKMRWSVEVEQQIDEKIHQNWASTI